MPDSCGQRPPFERRRLPTPRSGAQRGAATYHPRREARSGSVSADPKGRTRAWHGVRTPFRRRVGRVTARPHGAPGAPSLTKIRLFVRQDEFPFETLSGGEGEKRVRGGKSGARKGGRPGTIVKAQVSLPSDLGLRGRARGSSSGSLGSIRADRRKGRRAACAGLFRSGAHRRQFDAADSPSGRNIQKSCWQQARAKRPEVGRPPGCRRPAQGQLPCAWRRASG